MGRKDGQRTCWQPETHLITIFRFLQLNQIGALEQDSHLERSLTCWLIKIVKCNSDGNETRTSMLIHVHSCTPLMKELLLRLSKHKSKPNSSFFFFIFFFFLFFLVFICMCNCATVQHTCKWHILLQKSQSKMPRKMPDCIWGALEIAHTQCCHWHFCPPDSYR